MKDAKTYTATVTSLPESMVEIKGELAWDTFMTYEQKAFERLAAHLELDGFRKGHVPEAVARKHITDALVLPDMAELAIQELYPTILEDNNIDAIGRPELAITKIARDNALGFTLKTAVLPAIKLPDYKKLAKDAAPLEKKEVTEADIDKVIEDLRQMRAYGHVHSATDEHAHTEPLPNVDDAFAATFGLETVTAMRAKVRENLEREREVESKDKRRIEIMESIVAGTTFDVPLIILQSEQEKILAQIEADISRAGMTMDDYLKQVNKTKEVLLEDYKPEAEKRARFQMVVNAIARDAKLAPTDEEVQKEAEQLIASYPGADMSRAAAYADMVLTNEKVFNLLENQ